MPPAGFKRSRALWDEARRPRAQKVEEWKSLLRAILYELQPIRFSQCHVSAWVAVCKTRVLPGIHRVTSFTWGTLLPRLWSLIRNMTVRHWMIVGAIVLYYLVVRWIHELLEAGPLVLITTALVIIFTVGLGDNRDDGELSAYSVFNRGFQRLMGSVDVEHLVNQHVGGGMMMGGVMPAPAPMMDHPPQGNNRHHRLNHGHDDDDDNNDHNPPPQQQAGPQNRKKSGKKARRKNLEEREELRRQREAARAMGFDGTGGQEELMAMQRLIEDQVAAQNNGGN